MSIIYFPKNKKKASKVRKIVIDTDGKSFADHKYIQKIMNEHGYKRTEDKILQSLKKIGYIYK